MQIKSASNRRPMAQNVQRESSYSDRYYFQDLLALHSTLGYWWYGLWRRITKLHLNEYHPNQIISMLGHTDLQNQQCCYSRSNKIEVCENELAKCFWQSRWLDHQLGWVGLPTFLAPQFLHWIHPKRIFLHQTNWRCMSFLSTPPLAGGRVWDFFSIWRRLKVNIYHRAAPLPSFDFHSRLSSYASYTEIRVCFLFKVSRDCFRTPRHVVTLCWKCGNFTAL